MYKEILNTIKEYNTIIISRHHHPDLDALGSQLGLASLLKDNFKDKQIYVVGDMAKPCFLGEMDEIDEATFENALLIFTDVSVDNMIAKIDYQKASKVICIDHHKNECNLINAKAYYNHNAAAACQIIADFAFINNLYISNKTFNCLYAGIISDSNRFNFSLSKDLFETVGKLIDLGYDYRYIYDSMYSDSVKNVKMRAYFTSLFQVSENGVGYIKSDKSIFEKFNVDFFSISRGMVNVMANLKEVKIWANFTEDPNTNNVVCEFRSKSIDILPIAIKYGGGGHNNACGATVSSFDVVESILKDLEELAKE